MQEEEQSQDRSRGKAGESERLEKHLRTLAVRLDEGIHAQLQFIAQLRGTSISDEIRRAIENRIATAQDDPELIARAQEVREEIEREAAARSAAIAGFLGCQHSRRPLRRTKLRPAKHVAAAKQRMHKEGDGHD
jgi:hypothetical protein